MPRFSSPVDNMVLHNVEWWWVIIKILQNFEILKFSILLEKGKNIFFLKFGILAGRIRDHTMR